MTFLIRAVHAEVHARHVECATTCAITWVLFACCLCRRPPEERERDGGESTPTSFYSCTGESTPTSRITPTYGTSKLLYSG